MGVQPEQQGGREPRWALDAGGGGEGGERRAAEERTAAHSESLRKHCARLAIQLAEVTQLAEQQEADAEAEPEAEEGDAA